MPEPFSINVHFRKDKISPKTGKAPINLRVRVYSEERKFPTKHNATENDWDSKKKRLKNSLEQAKLEDTVAKLRKYLQIKDYETDGDISMQTAKDFFDDKKKIKNKYQSFHDLYSQYIEEKRKDGNSESTIKNYIGSHNVLREYKSNIKISDITLEFIHKFDDFLSKKRDNADGGRENNHRNLRTVISYAKNSGFPIENFYGKGHGKFQMPKSKSPKIYLTKDEVKKLRDLILTFDKFSTKRRVLQMFIFGCCTGFRISDITSLQWKDVDFTKKRIKKIQQKTKTPVTAIINPIVTFSILDFKAEKQGENSLVFKKFDNSTLRKHLKKIVKSVGITKDVGFHTARRTFATLKLHDKTPVATISKLLGHKSIRTTEKYLGIEDDTLLDIHEQEEQGRSFLLTPKTKK